MRGQRSNFREIDIFSYLHEYISKTINLSDKKLSSACSRPFNSKQNRVLLQFIGGIFVRDGIPEGNSRPHRQNGLRENWVNGPD